MQNVKMNWLRLNKERMMGMTRDDCKAAIREAEAAGDLFAAQWMRVKFNIWA